MNATLIIGLRPDQAAQVARRHPGLQLRHLASTQGQKTLAAQAAAADRVLIMVRFVTHQHQVIAQQHCARVSLVLGGLSSLDRALAALEATTHA